MYSRERSLYIKARIFYAITLLMKRDTCFIKHDMPLFTDTSCFNGCSKNSCKTYFTYACLNTNVYYVSSLHVPNKHCDQIHPHMFCGWAKVYREGHDSAVYIIFQASLS